MSTFGALLIAGAIFAGIFGLQRSPNNQKIERQESQASSRSLSSEELQTRLSLYNQLKFSADYRGNKDGKVSPGEWDEVYSNFNLNYVDGKSNPARDLTTDQMRLYIENENSWPIRPRVEREDP
jgi:hypothetical protein